MNIVMSCNNSNDSTPYDELLSQTPYTALTDSLRSNPSNDEIYYRRGILLMKNNHLPPALADFEKAWSLNKKEEYAISASELLLRKKKDSAIIFLNNALKILPGSIALQLKLAQAYIDREKQDEALKICNDIIQNKPSQIDALIMKSDLLLAKKDTAESIKTLEQAHKYSPFDEDISFNLGFGYAETKNHKALSLTDSLLKAEGTNKKAEPYYFKGVYYANTGNKTKALDFFDQAIQHDYNFLDAYLEKGKILYDQRKMTEAEKVFQLSLTISSTEADAYYWLAKCQEANGKKSEAKLNYERAFGLDKTLTEAKEAAERIVD